MARLISIAEARRRVLDAVVPLEHEAVAVTEALNRVLAHDLRAALEVPPFPSSAMDGYAVHEGPAGRTLSVVGESRAGAPTTQEVGQDQAIRISTGAAVPSGATAVVRQEDVEAKDGAILIKTEVAPGEHIRPAGEVMRAGMTVLEAGATLRAAEIGVAISAGAGDVLVARRPRVAVLTTGDELREPGEPLGPGEIHNSNGPVLASLAAAAGAAALDPVKLPDERGATETGLRQALEEADVVIISGGVSVGPHDHVKPALAALGVEQLFWGVALQPGKPTWFGVRGRTLVFGLPGNPVSAVVTFALFAAPALAGLQGTTPKRALEAEAELAVPVRRNPRREQALRVRLERRDGTTLVTPNGPQGSHVVTSLVGADALALIPSGEGMLEAGTPVVLEPLPR